MLPHHRDQDEDGGNKNSSEGDLGDGAGGKRFDFALGAVSGGFFVPSGESGEKKEREEGEDDGDDAVSIVRV